MAKLERCIRKPYLLCLPPTECVFHEPVTIDGQTMQNFVWKNKEISFVCTDEGATEVKMKGIYIDGYQSYDYYPGTYLMDFYRLNGATNQLEVASQEIQLVKNEDGKELLA